MVEQPIAFYSTGGSHNGFARTDGLSPTLKVGSGLGIPSPPAIAFSHIRVVSPTLTHYNLDSRSPQSEEQQRIVRAVHEVTSTVRRLTPMECERLMFFPDGWTDIPWRKKDTSPDSRRYAACGNAVVSSVSYWIGWRLAQVLNG